MAIFPNIEADLVVQVGDKFRIDASKSYISKGETAITKVEIEPEAGSGLIDVSGSTPLKDTNWYLDWEYQASGSKVITVQITTDGAPLSKTLTITCVTEAVDRLFSTDQDLERIESSILKYVPRGKNSFKYAHREAQSQILEWLYINGYRRTDGERVTKENVLDLENVKYWSIYATLRIIFQDLSNQPDDIFDRKSKYYQDMEHKARENALLKLDLNNDNEQGPYEGYNMTTRNLIRV